MAVVGILLAMGLLGVGARELVFNLSHVQINKYDKPVKILDANAMIDSVKLEKVSKWPPYPKEAFIGETQEKSKQWVKGWYVQINGRNLVSKPYIGYMVNAEPIKIILGKKERGSQD